jgi:hypothetical protein
MITHVIIYSFTPKKHFCMKKGQPKKEHRVHVDGIPSLAFDLGPGSEPPILVFPFFNSNSSVKLPT